jgi:ATP-binding cassette, subfamily B, bacterial PglK
MSTTHKVFSLLTRPQRKAALLLLGLMFIGTALETMGIGLVIPAVAVLVQTDLATAYPRLKPVLASLGNPTQSQLIVGGMIALVLMYLCKALFLAILAWKQTRFAFDVQAELSQRLFATYLRQPYSFHLQRNSAQLVLNVHTEVNQFTFSAILPALLIATEGLVIAGIAALLLIVETTGTIVVGAILGAAAWGFHYLVDRQIDQSAASRQHHEGLRLQHLQQGLWGAKEVKLLGREASFLDEYQTHTLHSARASQIYHTLLQLPRLWLELLGIVGLAALTLTALAKGYDISRTMPALAVFAAAAFRLMPSVARISGAVQMLRYASPIAETLHAELTALSVAPTVISTVPVTFLRNLELSEVVYAYPGSVAPSLKGLSIAVRKGESVGFVGPSGAGKSTLVDVILGLLTPTAGRVTVDGRDIHENVRAWQDTIGYVQQTIYLTDDTIRRNVAFGLADESIDDVAVNRAIRAAQLETFTATLPHGLETIVGERGVRLSGGQRQRIGIARALYHDPSVLVLDEATSALDTTTEAGVMQAVMALRRSKTILVVAHRLSTVEHCDRLYRLEHGRVVAAGSTAEVLRAERF